MHTDRHTPKPDANEAEENLPKSDLAEQAAPGSPIDPAISEAVERDIADSESASAKGDPNDPWNVEDKLGDILRLQDRVAESSREFAELLAGVEGNLADILHDKLMEVRTLQDRITALAFAYEGEATARARDRYDPARASVRRAWLKAELDARDLDSPYELTKDRELAPAYHTIQEYLAGFTGKRTLRVRKKLARALSRKPWPEVKLGEVPE